jgi:hypothetical protein
MERTEKEIIIGHKSPDIQPGIVFAPYIPMQSTGIIESDLLKKAEKKVRAFNRERKIDSILEDTEYIPMDIKETDEYKEFEEKYMKPIKGIKSRYTLADGKSWKRGE